MSLFYSIGKVFMIFKVVIYLLSEIFDNDGNMKDIDTIMKPEKE